MLERLGFQLSEVTLGFASVIRCLLSRIGRLVAPSIRIDRCRTARAGTSDHKYRRNTLETLKADTRMRYLGGGRLRAL